MLYWVGGIVVVLVLLFLLLRWLLRISDLRGLQELRPVPRAQLEQQLERILETNRALGDETRVEINAGLVMVPCPLWRCSRDGMVQQSMTVLPTPFSDYSFGLKAEELMDDDVWAALVDVAEVMQHASKATHRALFDHIDLYEGDMKDAPELVPSIPYLTGDRALSLLLVDFQRGLAAGATTKELRARWCDPSGSPPSLVEKLQRNEEAEAAALMEAMSGMAAGGAPASETDSIRARFFTPGRAARHEALMQAVADQHGKDIDQLEGPSLLQLEVSGLPVPLDFVRDLGAHISPLGSREVDGQTLSLAALKALALSNLSSFGPQPELPDERISVLEEIEDHAAAKVMLIPDMLPDDARVWAVAPAHGCLILFDRDDPDQVRAAREAFDAGFEKGGRDAPLPDPIEIAPAGYAPSSWP